MWKCGYICITFFWSIIVIFNYHCGMFYFGADLMLLTAVRVQYVCQGTNESQSPVWVLYNRCLAPFHNDQQLYTAWHFTVLRAVYAVTLWHWYFLCTFYGLRETIFFPNAIYQDAMPLFIPGSDFTSCEVFYDCRVDPCYLWVDHKAEKMRNSMNSLWMFTIIPLLFH